jgi:hypothetical protein
MEDYEIRDVMNRATSPNVDVEFAYDNTNYTVFDPEYSLHIMVRNQGNQVVERFRLHFTFPNFGNQVTLRDSLDPGHLYYELYRVEKSHDGGNYVIGFRSGDILFPEDGTNISEIINLRYKIDTNLHQRLVERKTAGDEIAVRWVLYADNMPPKTGAIPFSALYDSDR